MERGFGLWRWGGRWRLGLLESSQTTNPVGAGLLAKASVQSTSMLNAKPPSRASPLPQVLRPWVKPLRRVWACGPGSKHRPVPRQRPSTGGPGPVRWRQ
ncbi:hypothetical protein DJ564_29930 [Pseudomonas sp. 31-12]|nr:hypothetical protein DJ564_29930 [Pseudomonas sp. 31-12]